MHGYEMIQELDQRTGGAWRPSPGSVYPTLQLLEDEGLIESRRVKGGRKQFTLTEAGQAEAAQAAQNAAVDRVRGRDDRQLAGHPRGRRCSAMNALRQVMRNGTDEQRARAARGARRGAAQAVRDPRRVRVESDPTRHDHGVPKATGAGRTLIRTDAKRRSRYGGTAAIFGRKVSGR